MFHSPSAVLMVYNFLQKLSTKIVHKNFPQKYFTKIVNQGLIFTYSDKYMYYLNDKIIY